MPDDLLNFHQAVSDLQAYEEEMLDNHKSVNEFLVEAIDQASQLYNTANNVEYDQDGEFKIIIYNQLFCSKLLIIIYLNHNFFKNQKYNNVQSNFQKNIY